MADDRATDNQLVDDQAEDRTGGDSATSAQETEDRWFFLVDPMWQPVFVAGADETEADADAAQSKGEDAQPHVGPPPLAALVGGWLVQADGTVGRFHPNPEYQPATPDSPTDPLDAALRLATRGDMEVEAVLSVLEEAVFGLAVDEKGQPVIAAAPDGEPCALAVTAPAHQPRVSAHEWRDVSVTELATVLGDNHVDVLLNPGASTSTRLLAETIERAAASHTA